jgi:hypothetical protein
MRPFFRSSSTTRLTVATGTVTARPWPRPRVLLAGVLDHVGLQWLAINLLIPYVYALSIR